jgi:hypothetical protein
MWKCQQCGVEKPPSAHQSRQKYCSRPCMAEAYRSRLIGKANPNHRSKRPMACIHCSGHYLSYTKTRKFCSQACYRAHYREGRAVARVRGGTKDLNHDAIAAVFEQLGCSVCHTHEAGGGFPDMVVGLIGITALVEVKNPETGYGKRGLTDSQKRFAGKWRGSPINVVHSEQEAIELVQDMRRRVRHAAAGQVARIAEEAGI